MSLRRIQTRKTSKDFNANNLNITNTAKLPTLYNVDLSLRSLYNSLENFGLISPTTLNTETDTVTFNCINKSSTPNLNLVVFQKNIADIDNNVIAWNTIPYTDIGQSFKFEYNTSLEMRIVDSYGSISDRINVEYGKLYEATDNGNLIEIGVSEYSNEFDILNNVTSPTTTNVIIYRNNKVLYKSSNLINGQTLNLRFNPTFFIGEANVVFTGTTTYPVRQGSIIDTTTVSNFNTEISLIGIKSTDIIISGEVDNYSYSLSNIVFS